MPGSRLLIVAGAAATDLEQLPAGIRALIDSVDEILVVAPALPSRLRWLASDTDKTRERADERLQAVLDQVEESAATARGAVGADDPLLAFEDAVREFDPDHLLIALRAGDRAGWQERGLIDDVLERFQLPVTVFQVPATSAR